MPGVAVAIRYAAQNHKCSGVRVPCSTVPAVNETWYRHPEHCHNSRLRSSTASEPPHLGHR